jgi:hypothetical protein
MLKIFRKILRIKYLINIDTGESHKLSNVTKACGIEKMARKNKWYVTERKYRELIDEDEIERIDGCVHCNKEDNTD